MLPRPRSVAAATDWRIIFASVKPRTIALTGALVLIGAYSLYLTLPVALSGGDARAYWTAWSSGELYASAGLYLGTYVYPPPFAELIYPLTFLPWEVFRVAGILAATGAYWWLLAPVSLSVRLAAMFAVGPAILGGNIEWLFGLVLVLGMRRSALWAIPALIKITPGIPALWFALRGEYRAFAIALGVGGAIVAMSFILEPGAWSYWAQFALASVHFPEEAWWPNAVLPLAIRIPLALALVVVAARDRPYLLPVVMILGQPDLNPPTFAILAAVPRLRAS